MSPISPQPPASHLSPKSPNVNPFSPLSPHLVKGTLKHKEDDSEMNKLLGLDPPIRSIIFYSRNKLLQLSHHARSPVGMGSLDTWYGPPVKAANTQYLEDPAIASIGPSNTSSGRRGGFGEGFGFGGGIGVGRGLARGGRNVGLRRQPDTVDVNGLPVESRQYGGQMGRFSVRNPPIRPVPDEKKDKRKDEEWRRPDRGAPRDVRRPTWQAREDESIEPAWMDDAAGPSNLGTTAEPEDPLIKFIPGEDMIAAHKRAMKARDKQGDWRGDTQPNTAGAASFFAMDPAIAASSATTSSAKPKSFNAADYLKQTKSTQSENVQTPETASGAFGSRFQRFFGAAAETSQTSQAIQGSQAPQPTQSTPEVVPVAAEDPRDDRMARLMGLLSTKPAPAPLDQASQHITSPPADVRSPPLFFQGPPQLPPSAPHPNILLQQLHGGLRDMPVSRPGQGLDHEQLRHHMQPATRPTQHFSSPPALMAQMYDRDMHHNATNISQDYQQFMRPQSGYPNLPPPGFIQNPPPFYGPPPTMGPPPLPQGYGRPNQQQSTGPPTPQYPSHLGPAQQDMLATLFADMRPRS